MNYSIDWDGPGEADDDSPLPGCMMPDGAEPCGAFQRLQEDNERLRLVMGKAREKLELYRQGSGEYVGGMEYTSLIRLIDETLVSA